MGTVMNAPTVLVVEDDETIRELADLILSQAGFAVLRAGKVEEAQELLARQRPAVILLDIQMPEISGLDLLGWLKQQRLNIPVVMMTASGDQQSVWAAMEGGALDYVLKPFTPNTLIMRVRKAIVASREAAAIRRNFTQDPSRTAGSRSNA